MTMEDWQQVRDLFDEVKELDTGARAARLAATGDERVGAEVRKLLTALAEAGEFIERPAAVVLGSVPEVLPEPMVANRRIGPYQMLREIGRGGMGVVWLATRADDAYQKQVAIKLVWPGPESGEVLRRFRQERQILAKLEHPNIARLLDGGTTEEGWPYVVMEYVEGLPITKYCAAHQLGLRERLELFRTVCAAVQHAHQNLIVHRDLKPGNILVTEDGTVKLLDFGIAKLLTPEVSASDFAATRTGLHLMTPEYASPEQVRNETITTASDVYSLGIVLYELLTGQRPYQFKNHSLAELERVICEQEPTAPSKSQKAEGGRRKSEGGQVAFQPTTDHRPPTTALRGDLDNILLLALRKEARERYSSVEQLSEDVRRYLAGEAVLAGEPTWGYRLGKFVRRNRVGVVTATLLLLTLLGGIAATSWQARVATEQARENRRLLYAAQMHLAQQAWETTNIGRLRELVESQRPTTTAAEDLRGFEWYYLWRRLHHNGERRSLPHPKEVWSVVYAPNGKRLASGDDTGTVRLWDAATGAELHALKGHSNTVCSVAWSGDGSKLATASYDKTVKVWDAATGQELGMLQGHTKRVNAALFAPDGRTLATGSDDGTVRLWDLVSWREVRTIQSGETWVRSLAYSPDGRLLAGGLSARVKLWDAVTGQELRTLNDYPGMVGAVAFAPDGKVLATGGNDHKVNLWDIQTGQRLAFFDTRSPIRSLAWSPDGQRLVSGHEDRAVRIWAVAKPKEIATLKGHLGQVWSVSYAPDGKTLATAGDDFSVRLWDLATALEITSFNAESVVTSFAVSPNGRRLAINGMFGLPTRIWELETGQVAMAYPELSVLIYVVAYSPDGKLLAMGGADRTVTLWDVATGKTFATLSGHTGPINAVAFAPNGRILATVNYDHAAKFWDTATQQEMAHLKGHTNLVSSIAFSPDSARFVTGSYDLTARLWDVATGQELAVLKGHRKPILTVAFSPNGTLLATGSADGTVKLWQVSTGQERAMIKGHAGHVRSLAFSPDGKRLATGSSEGVVRLWDVATGQEVLALAGHETVVNAVAFSPDGQLLLSGSTDGTVRYWRAATRWETDNAGK